MNRWDTIYKTAYLPHQVLPRFNEQFFESFLNLKDQKTYNSFHFFFSMKIDLSMSEGTQSKSAGFKPLVLTLSKNKVTWTSDSDVVFYTTSMFIKFRFCTQAESRKSEATSGCDKRMFKLSFCLFHWPLHF